MTDDEHLVYPVQAAARLTGLSTDTLRAWERRYEAVIPRRVGRGRGYTRQDIARLQLLRSAVQRGHSIGQIARLPDEALAGLIGGPAAQPHTPRTLDAIVEPLVDAVRAYDAPRVEREFSRLAAILSPSDLVLSAVVPVLRIIGDAWQHGTVRPGQEHLLSSVIRHGLGGLLRVLAAGVGAPRVLIATPSGERHELGALSAAVLAVSAGVGVVYLGADLPADEVAEATERTGVEVALLAFTAMPAAEARHYVQDLRRRMPQTVPLWVGGPAAPRVRGTRLTTGLEEFGAELSAFFAQRTRHAPPATGTAR